MQIALIAKLRHGGLTDVLQEKGWTQADLARAIPTSETAVSRWMQFKDLPRSPAMRARLERATGRLFDDLFPPEVQALIGADFPREMTAITEVPAHRLVGRGRPLLRTTLETDVLHAERHALLYAALAVLSPKEQRVLRLRFGLGDEEPHTLEACGAIVGCCRERVRAIERQALQKMGWKNKSAAMQQLREVGRP